MKEQGWISIHRQLKNHWLWQDPVKLKWWLDILLSVNHSDSKVNIGNDLVECKKGQSIKSLQTWAAEWRTTKDTARNFLKLLEKDKMILLENIKVSTRLTVCKYDTYQEGLHAKPTPSKRKPNGSQTPTHPNNNDNNEDNDNNILGEKDEAQIPKRTSEEIELSLLHPDIQIKFFEFKTWIKTEKLTKVSRLAPITPNQYAKLESAYGDDLIRDKTLAIENHKNNYTSLYLTLSKWLDKETKQKQTQGNLFSGILTDKERLKASIERNNARL